MTGWKVVMFISSLLSLALLGSVQGLMPDEVAEEGEVFATLGAVEPLLPSVDALVDL